MYAGGIGFAGFAGAVFAVHGAVFPLNRQRPLVADGVEGPDDFLEVNFTPPQAAEVPVAARIAERRYPPNTPAGLGVSLQ